MKRRTFLQSAPVGLGALLALKSALGQGGGEVRVRENIVTFAKDSSKVDALRKAVHAMKSRPVTDPMSWRFWAAVHQYPVNQGDLDAQGFPPHIKAELKASDLWAAPAEVKAAWYKCSHGFDPVPNAGIDFLSWHRIYLFYFENVLRAESPFKALSLPYWDQVTERALPFVFREEINNPLYVPQRDPNINKGANTSGMHYSALGAGDMFAAQINVDGATLRGFSRGIERNTHNRGHGAISGLMGHPYTAALDPIFWLHHANVDRLWSIWLRTHPAKDDTSIAAEWLSRQFSFYDLGKVTDAQVQRFLSNDIGYKYDVETIPVQERAQQPPPAAPRRVLKGRIPTTGARPGESRHGGFRLGNDGASILLPLSAEDKRDLSRVARFERMHDSKSSLVLVLNGVKPGRDALKYGFGFDVYFNFTSQSSATPSLVHSHRIGSFGPFELACSSRDCGANGRTLKFELNSAIQTLLSDEATLPSGAYISFVREGARDSSNNLYSLPSSADLVAVSSIALERGE